MHFIFVSVVLPHNMSQQAQCCREVAPMPGWLESGFGIYYIKGMITEFASLEKCIMFLLAAYSKFDCVFMCMYIVGTEISYICMWK